MRSRETGSREAGQAWRTRRATVVASVLTAVLVLTGASVADAGADPADDAHARAVAAMEAALTAQSEQAEAAGVTDAMHADATFALRGDDASFALRPDDATTGLEVVEEGDDSTVVTLTSDLLFDFGSAELTPQAERAVAELAEDIPQDVTVDVDGHTDSIGAEDFNQRLSEERAEAVAEVLGDARPDLELVVEGHGESSPVADNQVGGEDNPAGRALNRRVEVTYPTS